MKTVRKYHAGEPPVASPDELAVEEPLEIRVNGEAVSVTMRTPGEDAELALGFLLSEGMIRARADVAAVGAPSGGSVAPPTSARAEVCNVIDVALAPGVALDLAQLTRHVFASSSCGLCGKASIEAVHRNFPPLESRPQVSAATLLSLPDKLRAAQASFARTGGLHAAGVFDLEGNLVVLREDVGRHNAVDKVLGYALGNGLLPLDRHILMVSGRASFEIVQKALAGRLPIVVAVSAPSSLAVEFAEQSGQALVGFLREGRFNVYAGNDRVGF